MSDMQEVYKAIALTVKQQLTELYPPQLNSKTSRKRGHKFEGDRSEISPKNI